MCRYSEAALKALRTLAKNTRVLQSIYLREAIDDLLLKYRGLDCLPPRSPAWPEPHKSTHVMVSAAAKDELDDVHLQHRIQQSDLLRDALADLLVKYQAQWRPSEMQGPTYFNQVSCNVTPGCTSTLFLAYRQDETRMDLECKACGKTQNLNPLAPMEEGAPSSRPQQRHLALVPGADK